MRHANTDWNDYDGNDYGRVISTKGKKDTTIVLKELIKKRFEFNDEKTENVLNMAARLEGQSNDNVQFIKVIKESIAYEERFNLLKDSWILVMADGKRTYEEDGFMRLFCSLLGLSDKDSALARQFILKEQKTN